MLILTPASFSGKSPAGPSAAVDWVRSVNGQQHSEHGTGALAATPDDDDVVLVLPPQAVAWQRITPPKVPASRQRAMLEGMLEERVLSDTAVLHFALAPHTKAGQPTWVAVVQKDWLEAWLQALEVAGRTATRITPGWWPLPADAPEGAQAPTVHWAHLEEGRGWLASASALGVSCLPLQPGVAAATEWLQVADGPSAPPAQWLAEPAATALAEAHLDRRFELLTVQAWLLHSAQSAWNLAQFDLSLSPSARRGQRLRYGLREWRSAPGWRAARWGLAALALVQLVGLNASAWQERRALQAKKEALTQILRTSFPQVQLVLDAPVQMQRELANLRQASGQLSTSDFEAMLAGLAQAQGEAPLGLRGVQYEAQNNGASGRFTTDGGASLTPAAQEALQRAGWRVDAQDTTFTLRPAPP